MRRFDLTTSIQDNMNAIEYVLGADDVYDRKAAEILGRFPNIASQRYIDEDGRRSIVSYVREDTTLAMLMKEKLAKREVLYLLRGVVSVYESSSQGLPASYIIRDENYVYVDRESLTVKCVAVPVVQEPVSTSEIPAFFRKILSNLLFDEKDSDNYVAMLFTEINSADFSLARFKQYINEQLNQYNVRPAIRPTAVLQPQIPRPVEQSFPNQGALMGQLGNVSKPIPHMVRKKTGEQIFIKKPVFSIGKSKSKADYPLEDNPAISRVHCIIVQKNGVNYIRDNHSTNHTFLNGVELEPDKEMLLKHKSVIQMGDEEFTFLLRKGD